MFTTYVSAEISIPPVFDYSDERWWAYVNVPVFRPYFHLVVEYPDEQGDPISKTVLYSEVDQIVSTAKESGLKITDIQAVFPSHMTNNGRWSMEPVSEILFGLEPGLDFRQAAIIYVLSDGRRIVDSSLHTTEANLIDLQLIIRSSKIGDQS